MTKTSLEGHPVILLQLVSLDYINDRILVTARNEGYVFKGVCNFVHRESLSQHAPQVTLPGGLCPGRSLSMGVSVQGVSFRLRGVSVPPVRQRAGGTHATGMYSCCYVYHSTS